MGHIKEGKIAAIAAMAANRVIGSHNQLPWHLPADLRHFKQLTTGHAVLMGRKTYESIGKPLPNRINLVISRDPSYQAPGCVLMSSLEEGVAYARSSCLPAGQSLYIIGGAQIYQQSLSFVEEIYLTVLDRVFAGDAYFPALTEMEWQEIEREDHPADEQHVCAFSFLKLVRRG